MVPLITELTEPPIVGQYYRVSCVMARFRHDGKPLEVVVHGSWHEDSDYLGLQTHHYHIDLRFVSQRLMRARWTREGISAWFGQIIDEPVGEVMIRRRRMLREFPEWPHMATERSFAQLRQAFEGRELANGHCPHRGYDLSTIPPDSRGCRTCPLHGLVFDRSGRCVQPNRKRGA